MDFWEFCEVGFLLEISLLGRLRLLYVVTILGIDFRYMFHASVTRLASLYYFSRGVWSLGVLCQSLRCTVVTGWCQSDGRVVSGRVLIGSLIGFSCWVVSVWSQ